GQPSRPVDPDPVGNQAAGRGRAGPVQLLPAEPLPLRADGVGLHADDEPGMGDVIGSLSLGATRAFRIRHNATKETRTFHLGHGTLVIMAGTMQRFWKHEVLKTNEAVGERI